MTTSALNLGPDQFLVFGAFGAFGTGFAGEDITTFDDAVESIIEFISKSEEPDPSYRVLHVTFDVETNAPESTSDVTGDVQEAVAERLRVAA